MGKAMLAALATMQAGNAALGFRRRVAVAAVAVRVQFETL
jgi:hypothetical protein